MASGASRVQNEEGRGSRSQARVKCFLLWSSILKYSLDCVE